MELAQIRELLGDALGLELELLEGDNGAGDPALLVPAERWVDACRLARDHEQLQFDFLRALSGVDYLEPGYIEVVAHLFSYSRRHGCVLKTRVPREQARLASLSAVWPAAEWYEREIYDLLGVHFSGHRDLRRIMMPEDWPGHPLRKDYQQPATYHGIPTTRPREEVKAND